VSGPGNPAVGLPTLEDLPTVDGRRVLVRVDVNVPLRPDPDGRLEVADDFRVRATLPTLRWLVERGASVTCCAHLGRPEGRPTPETDMAPVRRVLERLAPGVELLDNLRWEAGEEAGDEAFARRLVDGFELFVNDAFGASHRCHASIVGPPRWLPSAAGRLLQREAEMIGGLLGSPERPFVAIVGGGKVRDKLGVLRALLAVVDRLVVGGGMAFTFLAAQGVPVGASLVDEAHIEDCRRLLDQAADRIVLPGDVVALGPDGTLGNGAAGSGPVQVVDQVPDGWRGVDIGPESARRFAAAVADAGTVFWNGPMGVFEDDRFTGGTRAVAEAVARCPGRSVVGGGDSAAALRRFSLKEAVDFVSTGGGASLELLEHGDLPGLAALRAASNAPGRRSAGG
jgi:phosphoglycerate kinase